MQGIGLSPLIDIPLVDSFPAFEDPSTVTGAASNSSAEVQANALNAMRELDLPFTAPPLTKMHLTDYIAFGMDILYYGSFELGTPGQSLTADFDTGSADLWVASECPSCFVPQYAPADSSTFEDSNQDFAIQYVRQSCLYLLKVTNKFIGYRRRLRKAGFRRLKYRRFES